MIYLIANLYFSPTDKVLRKYTDFFLYNNAKLSRYEKEALSSGAVLIYNPSFRTFMLLHLNGVPMDLKFFVHFFLRFFLILSYILTFQSQLNAINQFKKLSYNIHCSYSNTIKASDICHLLHDIILDLSATCISLTTLPAVICSFPAPKTC